ncbi:hypothetical protein NCAS_0E03210 [Naumovozyma castellii]|uniref:Major facilitator superfamily (MFS) profile domain-containing protein n=1 Tax=Naumovozyma castellii TaxID=27288 RepID=G0VFX2_NAUCA|nr:hypothetical protein NCAS_0E03210 [Naumovozyma castellii CBS 4309]CCC70391.1 hypothetical protein NCAS_0E03210 [Naumovozyma castellii CBS 4309]
MSEDSTTTYNSSGHSSSSTFPDPKQIKSVEDVSLKVKTNENEGAPKPISAYFTVICLCLMIAFGGFIFGWDIGTIGGFVGQTDFKRRFGELNDEGEYYLSDVRTGLIVATFNLGCAFGGIILGRLGDFYGRKIGLVCVVSVYVVGVVIQISSTNNWIQYFIGRIVSGLGVGGIAVLSPTLISEIAPKHLRGMCISLYQLMITGGIFVGYCTNYGSKSYTNSIQWRMPLGLGFAWALIMVLGMMMVPESPRYLIEKGKFEEAKRSLAKSNKTTVDDPIVLREFDVINAGVEAERAIGNASWAELFSTKGKVLQRVIMGIMVQSLQQLTGCNYFFYYGTTIFQAVGMDDSYVTSIVLGVVNFSSTFISLWSVERFGRRKCLLWGSASMACCFVVFASMGVTKLYPNGMDQPTSKSAGNVMIVFACLFIFCFAVSWAPIAFVVVAESYPQRIKQRAMAIAVAANWIWNFAIGFCTPFITSAINFYYGFVFFGCLIFSFFYIFFFVCETKGLSLEEFNEMYEEGTLPWKSDTWIPSSRRGADYDVHATQNDDQTFFQKIFSKK